MSIAFGTGTTRAVKEKVLALIRSGDLGPDGKLPTERDLAERFAVGRRYIRQALDALEEEGLVWRKQGKGTFAGQPVDPMGDLAAKITGQTTALEVMEARLCIEPELAALCADRMTEEEIARLRHLAQRQFEATDPQATELWDGSLHRLIAQCARNRPLLTAYSLLDRIRSNPDWVTLRAKGRSAASLAVTHNEHLAIIEAIAARHADSARIAMRDHLQTRFDALRDAPDVDLQATEARHG
ncbi:FadR/GntR family transcriptional regulator [Cognatishimia sp. F0-27]|uniref:FadR/GntR family transcriptional regulator n=1 Tax=Cognatishimia sp. F0-27 TaxID=2816855 RepID=UPI001D0CD475|nr:FCD domain-containing protein [Cognatishimia sp. F0-27]MCC1492870.1 FadR family transcriptional regulator [Cognatishimia sp. F0-27]